MFRHEDSPICLNKNKCTNKLCQFKHSQTNEQKQNSCDKCDFNTDSDEIIKTHITEFHVTKSDKQIEDKQIYDLYVETNFPEVFDLYLTNENHVPCYVSTASLLCCLQLLPRACAAHSCVLVCMSC